MQSTQLLALLAGLTLTAGCAGYADSCSYESTEIGYEEDEVGFSAGDLMSSLDVGEEVLVWEDGTTVDLSTSLDFDGGAVEHRYDTLQTADEGYCPDYLDVAPGAMAWTFTCSSEVM